MTVAELDGWRDRTGEREFYRAVIRRTTRSRELDCGHRIDAREPYRYSVSKLWGIVGLLQVTQCDSCMRHGDHY